MKEIIIGLVALSSTSAFAKCTHNKTGDFVPFSLESGVPTFRYGSKVITLARESAEGIAVTIKGKDGISHVYGEKNLLLQFHNNENDLGVQVYCERK